MMEDSSAKLKENMMFFVDSVTGEDVGELICEIEGENDGKDDGFFVDSIIGEDVAPNSEE